MTVEASPSDCGACAVYSACALGRLLDAGAPNDVVGFNAYYVEQERYRSSPGRLSLRTGGWLLRGRRPALCWVMSCGARRWGV